VKTSVLRPLAIPSLLIAALALSAPAARAQGGYGPRDFEAPPAANHGVSAASLAKFDQKLGSQVPLDLVFRDEEGREAPLASHLGRRPAVLALVFHSCPLLCSQILGSLTRTLRAVPLQPGADFDVLAVSFDPADTPSVAKEKKNAYLARYDRPGTENGWKFLTGDKEEIDALCEAVGFKYVYNPESKQFAHAAGIVVLTPGGQTAQYFFGIDYPPGDLEAAIKRAGEGRLGSKIASMLLLCYDYDSATGKYTLSIVRALRAFGTLTALSLGLYLFLMFRREFRGRPGGGDARGGDAGAAAAGDGPGT